MVFITGDTHGDFARIRDFAKHSHTDKGDIMIILGDAGINYYTGKRDEKLKRELDKLPLTLFCIHGNHEQRPYAIPTYKEVKWHGATAYIEPEHPSLVFAKDGEYYTFGARKAFVIGGAYSVDKDYRLMKGFKWFDNEQPSAEIKAAVTRNLDVLNWDVDVMLTHTTPRKNEPREMFLSYVDQSKVDRATETWLDGIEGRLKYRRWYCGHFHCEKKMGRVEIMFKNYTVLE